jgi:hypothetical protein
LQDKTKGEKCKCHEPIMPNLLLADLAAQFHFQTRPG